MPQGPRGDKRSANAVVCAVHVARIVTGEIKGIKQMTQPNRANGARAGGAACKVALSSARGTEIARTAAAVRWG